MCDRFIINTTSKPEFVKEDRDKSSSIWYYMSYSRLKYYGETQMEPRWVSFGQIEFNSNKSIDISYGFSIWVLGVGFRIWIFWRFGLGFGVWVNKHRFCKLLLGSTLTFVETGISYRFIY